MGVPTETSNSLIILCESRLWVGPGLSAAVLRWVPRPSTCWDCGWMGTIKIRTVLAAAGLLMAAYLWGAGELRAEDACTTRSQAEAVIAALGQGPELVMAVASAVPSDPSNCVPSFCAASEDEDDDTRAAIGAGISEAYTSSNPRRRMTWRASCAWRRVPRTATGLW